MTATGRYGDDNTELCRCRSTPQLNTYLYVIICNVIVVIIIIISVRAHAVILVACKVYNVRLVTERSQF